ncbi:hypothetical protein QLX67_08215 [Balneolaceae bacterium ANBcel3]|nr:hypothetical protein [Balneolaceae bacterium ANBcel3]
MIFKHRFFTPSARITKRLLAGCILFAFILMPCVSHGQFIRLSFDIESELIVEELRSLYFGEVVANAGVVRIPLGDMDMGVYRISGPPNLVVTLALDLPDYLTIEDEEGAEFQIPVSLETAYINRGVNQASEAMPMPPSFRFPIMADAPATPPGQPVPSSSAFVYVYGEIDIGDIPPGNYSANVFMSVEFD